MIENTNDVNSQATEPAQSVNGDSATQLNTIPTSTASINQAPVQSSAPEQTDAVPKGLNVWRDALQRSSTSAQLAMCLYMLEASISWDKSIMKAVSDPPLATQILLNRIVVQRAPYEKISVGFC